MNNLNWNQFKQAYKNASQYRKEVFDSENSALCIRKIVNINQLDDSHYPKMLNIYSLYILEAKTDEEAIFDLRELAIPKSELVHKQIITCLNISNKKQEKVYTETKTESPIYKNTEQNTANINSISENKDLTPRWETES